MGAWARFPAIQRQQVAKPLSTYEAAAKGYRDAAIAAAFPSGTIRSSNCRSARGGALLDGERGGKERRGRRVAIQQRCVKDTTPSARYNPICSLKEWVAQTVGVVSNEAGHLETGLLFVRARGDFDKGTVEAQVTSSSASPANTLLRSRKLRSESSTELASDQHGRCQSTISAATSVSHTLEQTLPGNWTASVASPPWVGRAKR